MAHTCNPSYSGGSDEEDRGQPGQIVCPTLSRKYPTQKKGWRNGWSDTALA
jgi:hypothetical protein